MWILPVQSIRRAIGRRSSLWNNPDFIRFWIGETIANFGGFLGVLALPIIAAVTLDASPVQMGILGASSNLPRMVVGIFAGAWVDQRKRRPVMIGINIGRALTMLLVPVFAYMGYLTFPLLLSVALLLGVQGIVFDSAWSAMVPNLVERKDLADANGKLWASMSVAQITGPAIAGTLIAWLTGPNVMAITAFTFCLSAWFMWRIQKPEPEFPRQVHLGPRELMTNIREGYAELINNQITRPLTTTLVGIAMGGGFSGAVYLLFLTREVGLDTRGVGLVMAAGGVGALLGSFVAAPAARKYGYGQVILWAGVIQGFMNLLIPFTWVAGAAQAMVVAACSLGAWLFYQAYDINRFSLRQAITPPQLMGRVASSTMTLIAACAMLGSLLGGLCGEVLGIRATLVIAGLLMMASMLTMMRTPVPAIRELPE